ncbi:hypothetical protein EJ05DRAFT_274077 [Pseudovirgaria hyperparasitica]|uniref:Transcription initiation factor TFIID subunit 12 domain-containing protein n=1 Tax=Pseudovirgaria hyperparasitica TaxID=470096 RepID=A0A6A6WDV1_9PEZI|nr:uncharacterized protein EJ05DRAFT_274077 [Pseudovirgaria hyperparasitica]KAF2760160.1 hypothetical protein EJ05DRAFT_274077 [Pseudovirgaria hyperparasitica]
MADQMAGQQGPPHLRLNPPLLKVEEIQRATFLDGATKAKYSEVFKKLWSYLDTNPESTEYKNAAMRLQEFSAKLRQMAGTYRQRMSQQAQQQNQGGQATANGQQNQGQQNQGQNNNAQPQSVQQSAQSGQNGQQSQQQQPQSAAQQGQARPEQSAQAPRGYPQSVINHIQTFPFVLPLGLDPRSPEGIEKLKNIKQAYATQLTRMESARVTIGKINAQLDQLNKSGQPIPENFLRQKAEAEQMHTTSRKYVEDFRTKQAQLTQELKVRQAAAKQGQQPANMQASTASAQSKVEGNTAPPPQQQQAMQPQQQQQQQQHPQQNQQSHQAPPQNVGPGVPRPTQSPATMGQQQQQQQHFPQQGQTPNIGAPMNGQHQQNGMQNGMNFQRPQPMPQQQNPMSAGPGGQQNSPQTQGPSHNNPVPLSHQDAVSAARSYSDPRPNGTPQQTSTPGFSPGNQRDVTNNPKMPIPKQLNVPAPVPVNMGPSRPTMGGSGASGMMGQPVLNKLPGYMLEGDSERVLSKKKLDELVRQITGGGDSAGGETLTPEVEETMLQLADDFVDNIISTACKVSKLRESNQLDIRDIQLVLERNYNIRVPGFASDEIRTVRKLHPAPGWNEKMKALQAAKIMGGKTDM